MRFLRTYFRSYPWGLQLGLFLLMILTMSGFGTFMVMTFLPKLTPYSFASMGAINENSPAPLISSYLVIQGILSVSIFLLPALIFAYLAHPDPKEYLGLRKPGKNIQLLLSILVMLGAMPILQLVQDLIGQIDFGPKVKASQAANESAFKAFLRQPDLISFVRTFIVLAIIPALGEELFFRGIWMRFFKKVSRNMTAPILVTSLIFAYVHANVYGLLSIIAAGALLALIYYLTGSIWCSILAHMFFNGSQVAVAYLQGANASTESAKTIPWIYVLAGAVIFSVSFYLLLKNKTPLPGNWTDDFPPDESGNNNWDFLPGKEN